MVIYAVINNINGNIYIGKTTRNIDIRKKEHIQKALKYSKTYFHKALKKYGIENFSWEILDNSCTEEKSLNIKETYYIGYFTGVQQIKKKKVYNLTIGGEGTKSLNVWKSLSSRKQEEIKTKASERNSGKNNFFYGKKGGKHICSKRYKLTSPNGKTYYIHGLRDFCRNNPSFNLKHNYLSYVARGKQKHYKGWLCEYLD